MDTSEATLKIKYIKAGFIGRSYVTQAFAELQEAGCIVLIGSENRRFLSTSWYDVEITGPYYKLKAFYDWARSEF